MKMWFCICALIAAAVVSAGAEEPARVVLRAEASVSAERILLGDVADLPRQAPAELHQLPLGNAPWPGHGRQISRMLVQARLISSGYDTLLPVGGAQVCLVKRPAARVSGEAIAEAAVHCVRARFPEGGPEVLISVRSQPEDVLVGEGEPPELRPSVAGTAAPVGKVRVDVDLLRDGLLLKRVPVSLQVSPYDRVAVASKPVSAGERLSAEKVAFTRLDLSSLQGDCLTAWAQIEGQVASRTIAPGEVIRRGMLRQPEPPVVIRPNERVFLVVRTKTLRAVTLGRATRSARLGEVATARNLTTGREVSGVACEDGAILVTLAGSANDG